MGSLCSKVHRKAKNIDKMKSWLKYVNVLGPFCDIFYLYPFITQRFLYTLYIKKKLIFLNNVTKKLLSKKLSILFWALCS